VTAFIVPGIYAALIEISLENGPHPWMFANLSLNLYVVPALILELRVVDVPVKAGENPITLVHVVPDVPESYCRLYEVIGDPPFMISDTKLETVAHVT
jgi:hypothetical protein